MRIIYTVGFSLIFCGGHNFLLGQEKLPSVFSSSSFLVSNQSTNNELTDKKEKKSGTSDHQPLNAIVVGASSGMGREVAKRLSKQGYTVGLVARRLPLLETLSRELEGPFYIKQIDVTDTDARLQLKELITQMGGLDLMVVSISANFDNVKTASTESSSATMDYSGQVNWETKKRILDVDCKGFISMADVAFESFVEQNPK